MNRETVIAVLRAEITSSDEFRTFLTQFSGDSNAWFARDGGDLWVAELGQQWNAEFVAVAQSFFDRYFADMGVSENLRPQVRLTDSRRGSWIMETTLTMATV